MKSNSNNGQWNVYEKCVIMSAMKMCEMKNANV